VHGEHDHHNEHGEGCCGGHGHDHGHDHGEEGGCCGGNGKGNGGCGCH
ncbi:MAG: peptidylprolyl isomerase, partial [Hafnia sp.]